jgi:hypothetical protein
MSCETESSGELNGVRRGAGAVVEVNLEIFEAGNGLTRDAGRAGEERSAVVPGATVSKISRSLPGRLNRLRRERRQNVRAGAESHGVVPALRSITMPNAVASPTPCRRCY